VIRLIWLGVLLPLTIPGLTLWAPIFATTLHYANKTQYSGPVKMVYDEIAETKLIYGLGSGVLVYFASIFAAPAFAPATAIFIPIWMWLTLRWAEDLVSTFRALRALWRMLRIPPHTLRSVQERREELHVRVHTFALSLGLPDNPEVFFTSNVEEDGTRTYRWGVSAFESATDGEGDDPVDTAQKWLLSRRDRSQKGRVRGNWDAITRYGGRGYVPEINNQS
jgi:glycerol-3-phosphate O-acyltransferase/dihydroxyacetone phosphate acyltransferase